MRVNRENGDLVTGNTLSPRVLLFAVAMVVAIAVAGFAGTRILSFFNPDVKQPIQFNHMLHVEEVGLECTDCHQYVTTEEFAGRPSLETCSGCHEDPLTESTEEALLVKYIQDAEEIPWRRLYRVPAHVYYSHRRHVTVAGLECNRCHGEIGLTSVPPRKPLKKLTMGFCLDCHEVLGASTDCNACHR